MTTGTGERGLAAFVAALAGIFGGWVSANAGSGLAPAALVGGGVAGGTYWVMTARRRRRERVRGRPAPDWWSDELARSLPYYTLLSADEQSDFIGRVQVLASELRIEGIDCQPEERDTLLIAACAAMMTAGHEGFDFPTTRDILVYPDAFDSTYQPDEDGEWLGQMLDAGPVIFSLRELRVGFTDADWTNVCVHELAHVLDAAWAFEAGGFRSDTDAEVQAKLADGRLQRRVRQGQSPLDDYAFEDAQEFFAVSSEVFFEDPQLLREYHADIYEWLKGVYNLDLAASSDRADERA